MAEHKFPTEVIDLPSLGKVYPKDSPLAEGKLEIKYMTTKEEDILMSENLIKKGLVIDKLLDSLIVTEGVKQENLILGDKNAALVASRILAYGPEYTCEIENPNGGGKFTQDFLYQRTTGTPTNKTLDEYNGRFCQTPEFPKGTYAYFSTLDASKELPYPYITKSHYNQTESFNYDQNIDQRDSVLNDGSYKRNVTHLGLNTPGREYTFLQEAIKSDVRVDVDQVRASRIDGINVIKSGIDYKVGEQINTSDPSIDAEIGQVLGKNIVSIGTSDTVLENTIAIDLTISKN